MMSDIGMECWDGYIQSTIQIQFLFSYTIGFFGFATDEYLLEDSVSYVCNILRESSGIYRL